MRTGDRDTFSALRRSPRAGAGRLHFCGLNPASSAHEHFPFGGAPFSEARHAGIHTTHRCCISAHISYYYSQLRGATEGCKGPRLGRDFLRCLRNFCAATALITFYRRHVVRERRTRISGLPSVTLNACERRQSGASSNGGGGSGASSGGGGGGGACGSGGDAQLVRVVLTKQGARMQGAAATKEIASGMRCPRGALAELSHRVACGARLRAKPREPRKARRATVSGPSVKHTASQQQEEARQPRFVCTEREWEVGSRERTAGGVERDTKRPGGWRGPAPPFPALACELRCAPLPRRSRKSGCITRRFEQGTADRAAVQAHAVGIVRTGHEGQVTRVSGTSSAPTGAAAARSPCD